MPTSLQQGINAAKAGQSKKALEHLKDAIIEEPQNADVWVWIAAIIDDLEKQEIFLNKALEIDPNNIPAQRGLSYLQKRKQHDERVKGQTLSDHTKPISPFPKNNHNVQPAHNSREAQLKSDSLVNLSAQAARDNTHTTQNETLQQFPRLTTFEIILLSIVVIVFAFIGLLASSALLDFDLPLGFLGGNRPRLTSEPPYPGAFLYEDEVYFDIEGHDGPPMVNVGIPTCSSAKPVIVFWQMDVELGSVNLIHESGSYVSHRTFQSGNRGKLIQPSTELQNGLYCLMDTHQTTPSSTDTFYCFQIDRAEGE